MKTPEDQFIDGKPEGPHVFIQWKGTKVCADIHCTCGELGHVDDAFMYYVRCPKCGTLYEIGCHVAMRPVAAPYEGTATSCIKTWELYEVRRRPLDS